MNPTFESVPDRSEPLRTPAHLVAAIGRVREHIDHHYDQTIELDELSRLSGLSRFHLNRTFRRLVGLPPGPTRSTAASRRPRPSWPQARRSPTWRSRWAFGTRATSPGTSNAWCA